MQSCTNVIYTSVLLDGTTESFHAYAFLINNNNNNKICTEYQEKNDLQVIGSDFDLNPSLNFFV